MELTPALRSMGQASQEFTSEDRELLRDSVRGLLGRDWPVESAVAHAQDPARVRGIWKQLCDLGLGALGADATSGDWQSTCLVLGELGGAACPAPLLEATLVNRVAARSEGGDATMAGFIAAMQAGGALPALALADFDGDAEAGKCSYVSGSVSGRVAMVDGAQSATHLLIAIDGEPGLALVELAAPGVEITPMPGLAIPAWSAVRLTAARALAIPVDRECLGDLARLSRLGVLARSLGATRRSFELAVEHAKTRRQFGQPIGRFQAIQHKLADSLIAIEATALLIEQAADRYDSDGDDWRVHAAAAVAFGGPALRQATLEAHHVLAAVGYAEEHEAPRHFRRVHADLARHDAGRQAREELADHVLGEGGAGLPDVDLGPEPEVFRREVRAWLARHWDADAQRRHRQRPFNQRDVDREFSRLVGEQGWLAVSWPREYGGQARSPLEQYVFVDEMAYCGAPNGAHSVTSELVGPALIAYGTDAQKAEFLPEFQRGERMFSLGYSESEAGSDLAALRFSATRDGDGWLLNGEKLWTTRGELADYHWLAARTDTKAAPSHAGITMFMVPLAMPGITIRPSMALYGHTFASVHYENVRVPDAARVGDVNGGWKIITHALAAERVLMGAYVAKIRRLFDDLARHLATARRGERAMRDDIIVRDRVGALAAEIMAARLLAVRSVKLVEQGRVPVHEAAMSKVFAGELMERLTETAVDLLGAVGTLGEECKSAPLDGQVEQMLRRSIMMVIGGGTAQIQRNLIAQRGLGLPR